MALAYNTPSYDGVAVAVIPMENENYICWVLQMCLRHGIVLVSDCFHFNTPSYDGVCMNIVTRSGFGRTILPIQKLQKGVPSSINYSRFDRDEFMKQTTVATVKKAATKKRKTGNTKSNNNVKLFKSNQYNTSIIKNKNTKWCME